MIGSDAPAAETGPAPNRRLGSARVERVKLNIRSSGKAEIYRSRAALAGRFAHDLPHGLAPRRHSHDDIAAHAGLAGETEIPPGPHRQLPGLSAAFPGRQTFSALPAASDAPGEMSSPPWGTRPHGQSLYTCRRSHAHRRILWRSATAGRPRCGAQAHPIFQLRPYTHWLEDHPVLLTTHQPTRSDPVTILRTTLRLKNSGR